MRIVIDLSDIGHRLSRMVTALFPTTDRDRCWTCRAKLKPEEREAYGQSCERCEGYWMRKLEGSL